MLHAMFVLLLLMPVLVLLRRDVLASKVVPAASHATEQACQLGMRLTGNMTCCLPGEWQPSVWDNCLNMQLLVQ